MIPSSFKESNTWLDAPDGLECDPLSICRMDIVMDDGQKVPVVISCWKLTPDELEEVNCTGRVWLTVLGTTTQPVILSGHKPTMEPE